MPIVEPLTRAEIKAFVSAKEANGESWPRDPDGAPLYPGDAAVLSAEELRSRAASDAPFSLRLAMQRALFDSAEEGEILVIEKIEVAEPKTKLMAQVIDKVAPEGNRILLVDDTFERHATLAARNLPRISMCDTASLNVLDLVSSDRVILTLRSIDTLLARLGRKVS